MQQTNRNDKLKKAKTVLEEYVQFRIYKVNILKQIEVCFFIYFNNLNETKIKKKDQK